MFGLQVECSGDPAEGQQGLAVGGFCPGGEKECGLGLVDVLARCADEGQGVKDIGLIGAVDRFSLQDVAGLGSDDRLQGDGDARIRPVSALVVECGAMAVEQAGQRGGLVVTKDTGNRAGVLRIRHSPKNRDTASCCQCRVVVRFGNVVLDRVRVLIEGQLGLLCTNVPAVAAG
ncbi:hypothetical protein MHW47_05220 [Streptomyces sp. OfavH-34-F]|uniref:hypothetical protein n=1 Tax=Streptomyces sp. OfavH-34-F TaxID=2917760 RepID=UPI001EF27678|nr:hypothetical protein [Streptomyces sp. OfavH-34-F]MCG7523848.1 hypothetical protein [Streptomyces sp. OfavH-34-F]